MLDYDVERRGTLARYEYLYRRIRDDILSGELAADDRLPSKRQLAAQLGVSLATVEGAYTQLEAEGYVEARPRRGYYVNALPRLGQRAAVPVHMESDGATEEDTPSLVADFSAPATRADSSAANLWERALRQALAQEPREELFGAQPAEGTGRLRAAIAGHLRGTRGVDVDPACIVVGAGAQTVYAMVARLMGTDATFAVEDPGYGRVWATYASCGNQVVFVPTDEEGIRADLLAQTGATVAHVMPSHQFPTGCVTSAARRYELLGWAAAAEGRYLVEDDYDCEFRMAGRPVSPLLAADAGGRVIYVNTFSKSLSSALRLAYLVLPPQLAQAWRERLGFLSCTVSVVDQVALARLLESGDYERHVMRYRAAQRKLRDRLVGAIEASSLAGQAAFEEVDSGLHFVLAVGVGEGKDAVETERAVARAALARGVRLAPLSSYAHDVANSARPDGRARFVMQYDGLDPAAIPQVVAALEDAVAEA